MPAESTLTPSKVHLSHQDTSRPAPPISNTVHTRQLAVPPDAFLHFWTVARVPSLDCLLLFRHRQMPTLSRGSCTVRPRGEACSPPVLGSCHTGPLSGFLPFIPSVVLSWRPTCSPSLPASPGLGPRSKMESGARPPIGQKLRKFPSCELCAPGPWNQLETARRKPE